MNSLRTTCIISHRTVILFLTPVEEHVADDSRTAINLEGVSAQHDPLQHHTLRVTAQKAASGHQVLHS